MDDNDLYALMWKLIALFSCVVVLTVGSCTVNQQYQVRALIETTGIDPISAGCAIYKMKNGSETCAMRAACE